MINIAEILDKCTKGTKLYSPIFGDVYLEKIRPHLAVIVNRNKDEKNLVEFLYDGRYTLNGECMLFPSKENRDWNTFKVGPNFKVGNWITNGKYTWKVISVDNFDYTLQNQLGEYVNDSIDYVNKVFHLWTIKDAKAGDVIFYDDGWTCIFKRIHGIWFSSYCFITCDGEFHTSYEEHAVDSTINGNVNPATKEQCNLLFQKIEEVGYKWNAETKTLEKLIKPKFKSGDKIIKKDNPTKCWSVQGDIDTYYCIVTEGGIANLPLKDQDDWELAPTPKFKVGDIITNKDDKNKVKLTITCVKDTHYLITFYNDKKGDYQSEKISLEYQDKYNLVIPKKFDISTLKPFDKVLVRDTNESRWSADMFSHYSDHDKYPFCTLGCSVSGFSQCIPFESNEHLLGTTNDCNEYYKTWQL